MRLTSLNSSGVATLLSIHPDSVFMRLSSLFRSLTHFVSFPTQTHTRTRSSKAAPQWMDVAKLLQERAADVATFTTALFRTRCSRLSTSGVYEAEGADGGQGTPATVAVATPPRYRRPASDNVPVTRVVRLARERAKRARSRGHSRNTSDVREAAKLHTDRGGELAFSPSFSSSPCVDATETEVEKERQAKARESRLLRLRIKQYHRRVLPVKRWNLLLKRRRRLWQRRRACALRRHRLRRAMLRSGKTPRQCRCCTSVRSTLRSAEPQGRAVSMWLPSHSRLVTRFHMHMRRLVLPAADVVVHGNTNDRRADSVAARQHHAAARGRLQAAITANSRRGVPVLGACAPPQLDEEHVRIAVADVSRCKHHRLLQRWCAAVSKPQKRISRTRNGRSIRPLPAYLVSDTSDTCVYHVQLVSTWSLMDPTSPQAVLRDVAVNLGIAFSPPDQPSQPAQQWSLTHDGTIDGDVTHHLQCRDTRVLHGHMWAAKGHLCVPVTLLLWASTSPSSSSTEPSGAPSSLSPSSCALYLLAPAPVRYQSPPSRLLRVRLVSLWTPCHAVDRLACTWEWWAPVWTAEESRTVLCGSVVSALKRATRRLKTNVDTHAHADFDLFVCPSWTTTTAATGTEMPLSQQQVAAQTILLVQRSTTHAGLAPGASTAGVQRTKRGTTTLTAVGETIQSRQQRAQRLGVWARRSFFRTARLFLGAMLAVRSWQRVAPATARAFDMRVRLVGRADSNTLRHLLGRPSFPGDYHPRVSSSSQRDHASTLQRTLRTYATPSSSQARVLVGADRADRRLDPAHAQPGCLLVRFQCSACGGSDDSAMLRAEKVGVVTTAPFFIQRLGRSVVLVWCLFPTTHAGASGTLVLMSAEALAEVENQALSTHLAVQRRRAERRRQPRRKRPRTSNLHREQHEPADVIVPYSGAVGELLDESVCTFVKCFPIYA